MAVATVVYKVEATVRQGGKKPISSSREVENMTIEEAKALARQMLAELLAQHPGWWLAETAIHYNVFFTV